MTVAQLIEALKKLPQDLPVYCMGDGWDEEIIRTPFLSSSVSLSRNAYLSERVLL